MSSNDFTPLDSNEVLQDDSGNLRNPYSSLFELLPVSIIALGVVLRHFGFAIWPSFLLVGAGLAVLFYLFFSWYLFKVQRYVVFEVVLSILFGIMFTIGVTGILYKIQYWPGADQMLLGSLYAGGLLTILTFILFLLHFKNERASIFYRTLLSRLLVMSAILFRIYFSL